MEIKDVFKPLQKYGCLISVREPNLCISLGSDDGKIMMAFNYDNNNLSWSAIKHHVSEDELIRLWQDSTMICLLNWIEMPKATDLYRNLFEVVIPISDCKKLILFDFSDTRRSREDLSDILFLLSRYSEYAHIILSLNENEKHLVCEALEINQRMSEDEQAETVRKLLNLRWVIFHSKLHSLLIDKENIYSIHTKMMGRLFCKRVRAITLMLAFVLAF